ncbi:MAG: ATP-binding cassette domain-containing protein [Eggerthellaceae bacterium]|nr:ATP-binding cassette domain-containing protein [Eggerthellaceae bacterium]
MTLFEARHIAASYVRAGEAVQLFSDASFTLEEGKIYDLTGPSGSGKSTLLRACALLMEHERGELYLEGRESAAFEPVQWRRRVCLVPQVPTLVAGTVRDNLVFPWKLKVHAGQAPPDDAALASLMEQAELVGIELGRDVSQLSGGQAARVALLRAFATKPQVLLLDEVDAALDDESAAAIGRLTSSLVGAGTTCLRIRHRSADGFASGTFALKDGTLMLQGDGSIDTF